MAKNNGDKKHGMEDRNSQTGNGDMDRYANDWRRHFDTMYAPTGNTYDYYDPAYRYGVGLRGEDRYRDYDWDRLEPEAQRDWDERNPRTTWDKVKDAVQHAWENAKEAVT